MENKEGRIEDIEEARIAAEAEKPIRDLAREEGFDPAAKGFFDIQAEQRAERALNAFREKNEAAKELINPELHKLKEELRDLNSQLESEFGEVMLSSKQLFVPDVINMKRGENGELISIRMGLLAEIKRDTYEGIGPLGKKVEERAIAARNDNSSQFLDAYKYDPEVKELVDRFLELREKTTKTKEEINNIYREKSSLYNKSENVNAFLERIGITKKFPDNFDLRTSRSDIYDAKPEDAGKVGEIVGKLHAALSVFDDFVLTKEQAEDFGIDLDIIAEKLKDLASSIRFAADYQIKPAQRQAYVDMIATTKTGKKWMAVY